MKKINLNNLYISSIKNIPGQSGVFSKESFAPGDTILYLNGEVVGFPSRTSIQIGENKHIEDKIGAFVNHSCYPSCKIEGNRVVADKEISPSDEITFDYSKNETTLASPFICSCCNKLISGNLSN
tara:strand:+ start:681 stop:1055 length:375 start_codon:yes stop_codon:yes gene_type:complete